MQGGKGGHRKGICHPDFLPKGLDPKCSEVERKLKEDLKDWLECGPLEGSIKTGRFLAIEKLFNDAGHYGKVS